MSKPRLLDLFCCAGGAAMGYYRAGFDVTGVDILPQPHYPFAFVQADALEYVRDHGAEYDAIHASPPCQGYSTTASIHGYSYPCLVEAVREVLTATGRPWVIENVKGSPLDGITLCGTMFDLRVYRHRIFESSLLLLAPSHPEHNGTTGSKHGYSKDTPYISVAGNNFNRVQGAAAMGIDWPMTRHELAQAIPPAYTTYIGGWLMRYLDTREVAA